MTRLGRRIDKASDSHVGELIRFSFYGQLAAIWE